MTQYVINKKFVTQVERTTRVLEIAESFGLVLGDKEFVVFDDLELEVDKGDIIYITGQSGSGKSLLLRELERQIRAEKRSVINLDDIEFKEIPLIDQIGKDTNDALRILSIAGLNDAYLFVRKPSELSDGQRYRFRIAKAIESSAEVWVADEFMAVLDRISAKVVAYSVQKTARKRGITVIVATTHKDLLDDLQPSLYIDKRYREKVLIERLEEK
jgi:ABC-type ATPase with predicted acetyltransferase domain